MTIGIICEYNPFHNGHVYHIQKIRDKYPDSTLVLCLNGYFLERGEISLLNKEKKTEIALCFGVDLVIELPALYGTQSADRFSEAAILLLNAAGVQKIVFGSETCDIARLESLATRQLETNFKPDQKSGKCYPAALNLALKEDTQIPPNDLLAISYIKAILKNKLFMDYEAILRTSNYHDTRSCDVIISASNIREKIKTNQAIEHYLPKQAFESLQSVDEILFFTLLKYKISTDNQLDSYLDVTEGLDHKLRKEINHVENVEELVLAVKSKRYTYNRIKRMLIHILLGIKAEDASAPISYIHILGFNETGKQYLKQHQKTFLLPTKIDFSSKIYFYEKRASLLYDMLTRSFASSFDQRNQPIVCNLLNDSNQK